MSETLKPCRAKQSHADAIALVQYIVDRDGSVDAPNESIAMSLNMRRSLGGGHWVVDFGRFVAARNHVKDGTTADGDPCTGYRLHYRTTSRGGELTLIDPTGDIGPHVKAVAETIKGWMSRESQHHTENSRQIETLERLADHALAMSDRRGVHLCHRMAAELETNGTVAPATMAEAMVWMSALAS